MKKHFVKRFLTLILTLFTFLLLVGCGNGKEIQFKLVDGADAPTEVNVEIGDLLSVPSLIAKNKKETFDVNVVVKDKNGNEVQINNNKVRATSMDGYTIEYTSGDKTYTITVKVIDTKAPKITVSAPDGMAVLLNQTVLIPVCTVSDASSSAIDASISVKDEDGNSVTVTDNTFVASKIGKYIISYEAVDASGNKGIKNLTVSCEKADLLNAFENEADVTYYAFNGTKEAVSENAFTGNAIKLTIDDDSNNTYRSINFPLKKDGEYISYEDLLVYEKVQLYVYITADNEIGLAHQTYPVTQGVNIIVFTREQIEAAYAFASAQYSENANGFLLNLRYQTNGMSLYLDNFIGIYPRDYEEPEPDKLSFEVESCDNLTVQLNELTKIPGCNVLDLDGNSVSYTVKVFQGNTEIELNDGAFTPTELGEYKVKYIVDSGELKGEKEITLISKKSVVLNDFISLTDITAATFEHEDFVLEDSVAFNKGIKIVAKNSEPSSWPQVYIPFKFNPTDEGFLSYDELKKFEKIQIVFKAKNAGTASLSNGDPRIDFKKGYVLVEFMMDAIKTAYTTYDVQYTEGNKGFYFTFPSVNGGDEFTFLRVIGVYSDDYDPEHQDLSENKVNCVDGLSIIKGMEMELPSASFKLSDGTVVPYTVEVKYNEEIVTVTDNKFIPTELGEYTFTYKAEGFDDQAFTVNAKNGWVLNDFNLVSDVVYIANANVYVGEDAIFNKSVKIQFNAGTNPYFSLKDKENNPINKAQADALKDVEFIEVLVYASAALSYELADGTEPIMLSTGWNVCKWDLSKFDVASYIHETSGFITYVRTEGGIYLVFDRITAILPDEYVEPVEPENKKVVEIEMVDGISIIKGEEFTIPTALFKDEDGEVVEHTVSVKHNSEVVTITDNKFIPTELGEYVLTFKAQGFEDLVYTLNAKNGWVLNDFSKEADIVWCSGSTIGMAPKAILGSGVSLSITGGVNPYIALYDKDGGSINSADVKKLKDVKYIEVVVWASANTSLELSDGTQPLTLNKGWNKVTWDLSKFDITPHMHATSGFIGFIRNSVELTLYFDRFTAILADDYTEPVEPAVELEMVDGITIVRGEEFDIPQAYYTDEQQQEVEYTVSVKHGEQVIEVVNNKFMPLALGEYTLTFKAEGFEDIVYTVNAKNGWLLNDFNKAADIVWCSGATIGMAPKAILGSAASLTVSSGVNPYIAFYDKDGNAINAGEVAKLEDVLFIELLVWASENTSLELSNGTEALTLNKGWNVCRWDLSKFDISAHMHSTSGFIGFIRNSAELTLYFDRFTAILSDEYVEPVEPVDESALVLNAFESASDITYINFGDISKTDDGVMITATSDASWAGIYVPLKENGGYISWKHLQQFEKIEIKVISSFAGEMGTANGNPMVAFSAGESTITLTLEQIIASKAASDVEYSENANGLYICLKAMTAGETLTFVSITGLNRVIPEEDKPVVLNAFENTSDITWQNFGTTSKTDDGVMITATAAASWSRIAVPLKNSTGYYTLEELEQFEKIEITVISSFAGEFCTAEGSASAAFNVGKSTVYFTIDQIKTAKASVSDQYTNDANGLYICLKAMAVGETLTFVSIKGIKGE